MRALIMDAKWIRHRKVKNIPTRTINRPLKDGDNLRCLMHESLELINSPCNFPTNAFRLAPKK
jgi:hypothetical protein